MVMVSHVNKFIFMKTRKTAGTSIEMYLEPFCAPPGHVVTEKTATKVTEFGIIGERLKGGEHPAGIDLRNHASASSVKDTIGNDVWQNYTRVTSVRNPFDRMVSQFYWINRNRAEQLRTKPFNRIKELFRTFVLAERSPNDREVVYIDDLFVIHEAIRYENMLGDLTRLADKVGFDPSATQLPMTKETAGLRQGRGFWDYYEDDETIAAVRKQLAWVFDHYDYPTTPQAAAPKEDATGGTP
jgi:Sulfotransferase family